MTAHPAHPSMTLQPIFLYMVVTRHERLSIPFFLGLTHESCITRALLGCLQAWFCSLIFLERLFLSYEVISGVVEARGITGLPLV
jgi:hypothetical protein